MDGHRVVEVSLGGSHAHGHGKALQHFIGIEADDVTTDDALLRTDCHQLHGGLGRVFGKGVVHRCERGLIDLHVIPMTFARLRLGQADRTDGRVGEHGSGNHLVVELATGHATPDTVSQTPTGTDGNGGEFCLAGDIAQRKYALDIGGLEFVDRDVASVIDCHTRSIKAEICGEGCAADGKQHHVLTRQHVAALAGHIDAGATLLERCGGKTRLYRDACFGHCSNQFFLQHRIETTQRRIAPYREGDVTAHRLQHPGKLHGNVACTEYRDLLRLLGQLEESIGCDAKLGTGNVGHDGLTTRGDDNTLCRVAIVTDGYRMRIHQPCCSLHDRYAIASEVVVVGGIDAADIGFSIGDERAPIKAAHVDVIAIALGVAQRVRHGGAVPHDLLGHAAPIDAGTTQQRIPFNQQARGAMQGSTVAGGNTTAATADAYQVVVVGVSHQTLWKAELPTQESCRYRYYSGDSVNRSSNVPTLPEHPSSPDHAPSSGSQSKWRALLSLTRMDRPIGVYLLLWPTLCALWFAADGLPSIGNLVIFTLGTVFTRAAGCAINDYADRDIDGHVARTRQRPLATGAVTPGEALATTAVLMLLAFLLVLFTNPLTIALSLVAAALAVAYPFSKRVTDFPQVVLGAAFGFGVPMAFAAETHSVPAVAWVLYAAAITWPVAYDTFYAMADREDDIPLGVRSTAVRLGHHDLTFVALMYALTFALLIVAGVISDRGPWWFAAIVIAIVLAVIEWRRASSRKADDCFAAFVSNHKIGAVLFLGIVIDTGSWTAAVAGS